MRVLISSYYPNNANDIIRSLMDTNIGHNLYVIYRGASENITNIPLGLYNQDCSVVVIKIKGLLDSDELMLIKLRHPEFYDSLCIYPYDL